MEREGDGGNVYKPPVAGKTRDIYHDHIVWVYRLCFSGLF